MSALNIQQIYAAAARSLMNQRCAKAYLHDIRGSLHAVFSAMELLERSARATSADSERVQKASALARRAISRHEQSILEVLRVLTLQSAELTTFDLAALLRELMQFLANDVAHKGVSWTLEAPDPLPIHADRSRLRLMLTGLLTSAVDAVPPGAVLPIRAERVGDNVTVTLASHGGYVGTHPTSSDSDDRRSGMTAAELNHVLALQSLEEDAGSLHVDRAFQPNGRLVLTYPAAPGG